MNGCSSNFCPCACVVSFSVVTSPTAHHSPPRKARSSTVAVVSDPKSVAAIYGLCFASAEPLSFADINDRLDLSQGSISQGLRVLREMGALRVVPVDTAEPSPAPPETRRREFFAPDLELRKLVSHWIEQRLEKQLKAGKGRLQAMRTAAYDDNAPQIDPASNPLR